jgi:hypothetical protein
MIIPIGYFLLSIGFIIRAYEDIKQPTAKAEKEEVDLL